MNDQGGADWACLLPRSVYRRNVAVINRVCAKPYIATQKNAPPTETRQVNNSHHPIAAAWHCARLEFGARWHHHARRGRLGGGKPAFVPVWCPMGLAARC